MVDSGSPVRWAASGVLITGPDDLTLLVRTHNRTGLVLPGGMVEAEEPRPRRRSGRCSRSWAWSYA
jgi:8-oxo-dGTP pyrophosphatase MutT (NUDIX family)